MHTKGDGFVLHQNEAVNLGVHGEDGDADLTVENDVGCKIVNGFGVGADACLRLKGLEVGVEIQAGLLVERNNLVAIDGTSKQGPVIDTDIPGRIAPGARFQFGAKSKEEREVGGEIGRAHV